MTITGLAARYVIFGILSTFILDILFNGASRVAGILYTSETFKLGTSNVSELFSFLTEGADSDYVDLFTAMDKLGEALLLLMIVVSMYLYMKRVLTGRESMSLIEIAFRIIFTFAIFYTWREFYDYLAQDLFYDGFFIKLFGTDGEFGNVLSGDGTSIGFSLAVSEILAYFIVGFVYAGSVIKSGVYYMERWINLMATLLLGPICIPMYIAPETENVAKSWVRSVFTQLLGMALSLIFIKAYVIAMTGYNGFDATITSLFGTTVASTSEVVDLLKAVVCLQLAGNSEKILNSVGLKTDKFGETAREVGMSLHTGAMAMKDVATFTGVPAAAAGAGAAGFDALGNVAERAGAPGAADLAHQAADGLRGIGGNGKGSAYADLGQAVSKSSALDNEQKSNVSNAEQNGVSVEEAAGKEFARSFIRKGGFAGLVGSDGKLTQRGQKALNQFIDNASGGSASYRVKQAAAQQVMSQLQAQQRLSNAIKAGEIKNMNGDDLTNLIKQATGDDNFQKMSYKDADGNKHEMDPAILTDRDGNFQGIMIGHGDDKVVLSGKSAAETSNINFKMDGEGKEVISQNGSGDFVRELEMGTKYDGPVKGDKNGDGEQAGNTAFKVDVDSQREMKDMNLGGLDNVSYMYKIDPNTSNKQSWSDKAMDYAYAGPGNGVPEWTGGSASSGGADVPSNGSMPPDTPSGGDGGGRHRPNHRGKHGKGNGDDNATGNSGTGNDSYDTGVPSDYAYTNGSSAKPRDYSTGNKPSSSNKPSKNSGNNKPPKDSGNNKPPKS